MFTPDPHRVYPFRVALLLGLLIFLPGVAARAQLTTGTVEGTLQTADHHALGGTALVIVGSPGFRITLHTGEDGGFALGLPYGRYEVYLDDKTGSDPALFTATFFVDPLRSTRVDLLAEASGALRLQPRPDAASAQTWSARVRRDLYPGPFGLLGVLLSQVPDSVTQPVDYVGIADNRLGLEAQRGLSWTDTEYKLQGMNVTDSYQPGHPLIVPDIGALEEVEVQGTGGAALSADDGVEVDAFLAEPTKSWHGSASTVDTGSPFSSTNLPPPGLRGPIQQSDRFLWFTRDRIEAGGPLGKWVDLYGSAAGEWASQTIPLASSGNDQQSRMLFANVRSRFQMGSHDQLDALFSGTTLDLSAGGVPAGLEAAARRMGPSFVLPGGFLNEAEADRFDSVQIGWTHELSADSTFGALQVRYAYLIADLDTTPTTGSGVQTRIELLGGAVTGVPPLANLATRDRHQVAATWQLGAFRYAGIRHQILVGGGWNAASPQNRFTTPQDMNLITANGVPAFVVEFNTPVDSRENVQSFAFPISDHVTLTPSLTVDIGLLADFSRGSVPAQGSAAGTFAPARAFSAQLDLIAWNSVSPHGGVAWLVPDGDGLVLRASYFRPFVPLAARYLDFGNPNSLGGSEYQWNDLNSDGQFEPGEQGALLLRFGGPYSSISPALHRPYASEVDVGAEVPLWRGASLSARFFRRDFKDRIAVLDTGVPFAAFTPVTILDPGPDGIPGTRDDQLLTVYDQNPATLGQDHYLLTNPPGLQMQNKGFLADVRMQLGPVVARASFAGMQSYGPTNPGDSALENDPGVVGTLQMDPNTLVNATGREFTDRGYAGRIEATYRLPAKWGGIEVVSVGDYLDGLAFSRQLLVTGLAQGPFLVAATPRGGLDGGNRAQFDGDWNLRFRREFRLPAGRVTATVDILNVINDGRSIQENDISGTSFNLRLPVAIQPPRNARFEVRYDF